MANTIKHSYRNTADALTQLVALEANVNALRIAGNFTGSHALVQENLEGIFTGLETLRQTLLTLIGKTRTYITNADTSLQAADASAAAQFLGAGN
jgi:hypothetical protein